MNEQEITKFAAEMAEKMPPVRTEEDLKILSRVLKKLTVEKALNAELDYHLDNESSSNSRNGYSKKTLLTQEGNMEIETPRDRKSTFEPMLVKKSQRKFTGTADQILSLYARGMTTRDISSVFQEMYDIDVSPSLISKVTDAVLDEVLEWQNRPLDEVYPILYLDCLVAKVKQDKRVINKSVYLALGVNMDGMKELLGMWISENEGSKFWLSVLTELQTRGVKEIFIACVDGLSGFPEAINTVFPKTKVQLCIVHMVRNSVKYVSYKDRKELTNELKKIYRSVELNEAETELERFADKWDKKYPTVSALWRRHWLNIIPLFDYPDEIRKVIYTTNAIESLNSVLRKATKNRKIFPDDSSAYKVIYLAAEQASRKWTMPIRDWKYALNRFMMERDK
jgi:transposase-like protein